MATGRLRPHRRTRRTDDGAALPSVSSSAERTIEESGGSPFSPSPAPHLEHPALGGAVPIPLTGLTASRSVPRDPLA